MSPESFYVAATVVALVQWVRLRDRRILALLAMFALLAVGHGQDDWFAARPWHLLGGTAGLVLLYLLSPRSAAPR
ncbi:MAG TPA: hypothetical protein VLI67_02355 [Vicinamibacteria bacterium]|nr:hypothetical protein [Vicinamibacteria bacterium]